MPERAIDLTPLNEAERIVLRLLAQGHTAKSIAARQGTTAGAVNERLREARRKTGAGSSRELARMLVSQENRDEKIGIADENLLAHPSDTEDAPPTVRRILIGGVITMLIIAAGLAALAVHRQTSEPMTRDQASIAQFDQSNPAELQRRLHAEKRDKAWTPVAEAALKAHYAMLPDVGGPSRTLTIRCGSTLCEVAGRIGPGLDGSAVDAAMRALQDTAIENDVRKLGFGDPLVHAFKSDASTPGRVSFAIFWPRADA